MLSEGLLGETPREAAGPRAKATVDGVRIGNPGMRETIALGCSASVSLQQYEFRLCTQRAS